MQSDPQAGAWSEHSVQLTQSDAEPHVGQRHPGERKIETIVIEGQLFAARANKVAPRPEGPPQRHSLRVRVDPNLSQVTMVAECEESLTGTAANIENASATHGKDWHISEWIKVPKPGIFCRGGSLPHA
jgi:hypothetical protein